MKFKNNHLFLLILAVCCLLILAACGTGPTAAGALSNGATANPILVATVQADQYWRDAQATATAQQATVETNYQRIQGTSQAATSTAVRQSTAQAMDARATEQSIAATGTAQAIELAVLANAATSQAEATSTARAEAVAAQGTAAAFQSTRQTFEIAQAQSQAQREKVVTAVTTTLVIVAAVLFAGLLAWFLWRVIPTLVSRSGVVRYGQHGNPLVLLERNGRTIITDPLAMLQAAAIINEGAGVAMPELTPNELQALVAGGRLRMLIEQARHAPGHPPLLPGEVTTHHRAGFLERTKTVRNGRDTNGRLPAGDYSLLPADDPSPIEADLPLPAGVSWQQLAQWRGPGLALGAGRQNQVITLDLACTPHLFGAGMSGSGKTRRLLRPLVAQALVDGTYVALMNESGADFSPFYDHPHVTVIRGNAADYMAVLEAAIGEMEEREAELRRAGVSEWRRLPPGLLVERPLMLMAIDELLALAMLLTPGEQRAFWGLLAAFASRARKVGMSSVGLATDPTYRALGQGGLNYRSQCGRVSFRMMQAAGSRAVLDEGGAEALDEGQFMALLDRPGVVRGVTANPGDEELGLYLAANPAPTLVRPEWLDVAASTESEEEDDDMEQRIRELTAEGLSMRAVQQEVFGYVGGKAYDVVKPIYNEVKALQQ